MRLPSSSAFKIAAGVIPLSLFACGRSTPEPTQDAAAPTGAGGGLFATGGTTTIGQPGTGGALADAGMGAGGTWGSGGTPGAGGDLGTGGLLGGATGLGGKLGSGGGSGTGGRIGSGGATSGSGGTFGTGGVISGSGGGAGGTVGTGGSPATGGSPGVDGAAGTGGSTGTVSYPPRFVGNIDTRGSIRTDFTTYWNQFTPENAGKWGSVQASSQSTFNWKSLDAMYQHCQDNNIIFKEHTFIWGAGQPAWLSSLTTTTGPAAVQNWMKSFCDRYPNTRLIDVVNEPPPHTTPKYKDTIGGAGTSGWDWIVNSFVWAHEACPNAILLLNDYNNIELSSDVQRAIDLVKAIQQAGAPIHALGCQTHGASNLPASTLKANIDRISAETGLPVYITEYDINVSDDAKQKQQYEDHFTMFWSNPNVKGITVWGYIEGATWQANTGIMTSDGIMRPAMSWLMEFLGR